MTEAEWSDGTDPVRLFTYLRRSRRCRPSRRQLLLLACAFCRGLPALLGEGCFCAPEALQVVEKVADGDATDEEVSAAYAAHAAAQDYSGGIFTPAERATLLTSESLDGRGATFTIPRAAEVASQAALATAHHEVTARFGRAWKSHEGDRAEAMRELLSAAKAAQCDLIREVLGNPFRPACLGSLSLSSPLPVALAAYERVLPGGHLDTVRLSVLADALEDAGCSDSDLLSHLRTPGLHVRGCWALDLVLGKE